MRTLARQLHGEQVAASFYDNLVHPSGLHAAAAAGPCPAQLRLELAARGLAEFAIPAEDPEHRWPHLREVLQHGGPLGPVEGEDGARVQGHVGGLDVEVGGAVSVQGAGGGVEVRPQRAEEGEDLLVLRGAQGGGAVGGGVGVEWGGGVAEGVLDPGVEDAGVPGPVEGVLAEGGDGGVARGPGLAAEGGGAGGGFSRVQATGALGEGGDGGVEEDEGGEEPRVQQRELGQDGGAEGVPDGDQRPRHRVAEHVGHVQQVPRVVVPRGVVALRVLIQHAAVPLVRDVGDPDPADAKPVGFRGGVEVRPQRLVELLGEAVGVGADDGDVAGLGGGVVDGRVLLHAQVQHVLLRAGRRAGELADVLRGHSVLRHVEGEGGCHGYEYWGRGTGNSFRLRA